MKERRRSRHTVSILMVHLVWVTKYRYPVLRGDMQRRCRELIIQMCDAEDVQILKGVVSKDHIHMYVEYPSKLSISDFVKRLKGRTSRRLQDEYPQLKERYWGRHSGRMVMESLARVAARVGSTAGRIRGQLAKIHRSIDSTWDRAPG